MNALTATRLWWAQSQLLRVVFALPLFLAVAYVTAWSVYWYQIGVIVFLGTTALMGLVYRIPIYYLGLAVALRPLIDTLWFIRVDMAGIALSLQRTTGILLPAFYVGVLALHLLVGREERGRRLPAGLLWGTLLFWLTTVLSATREVTAIKAAAIDFFRSYANLVFLFVGFVFCRRREFLDTLYKLFLLAIVVPVGVAVAQGVGLVPQTIFEEVATNTTASFLSAIDREQHRLSGLYYDPGSLVVVLLSGLVAALYLVSSDQPRGWRLAGWVALAALVFAMRNSYLRQGWVALAVMVATWLLLRKRFTALVVIVALGTLGVLANIEYMSKVFAGVWEVFYETDRRRLGYLWSGRIGAWMDITDWFAKASWGERLIGGGFGWQLEGEFRDVANPHNQLFAVLMYSGLLGSALWVLIHLSIFVVLWKNLELSRSGDRWVVGVQAVSVHFLIFQFMSVGSQPIEQFNLATPMLLAAGYVMWRQFAVHEERLIRASEARSGPATEPEPEAAAPALAAPGAGDPLPAR